MNHHTNDNAHIDTAPKVRYPTKKTDGVTGAAVMDWQIEPITSPSKIPSMASQKDYYCDWS